MERVLNTNDDAKSRFEERYQKELDRMKSSHEKEIEMSKRNLHDQYEQRIDSLKEMKDEYEKRCLRLDQDLRDKNKDYDTIMVEFRKLQKCGDEEVAMLKLEARGKGDDLTRVRNMYEDNLVAIKEAKIENEALRQKLEVLKSEYYKLESTQRQQSADIRAELAVARERLGNYELIEKELDQAIMHVAQGDSMPGEGAEIGSALIATITSAPTTSKRRIQQSLLLANRLSAKQKENEALQEEITKLRDQLHNQEAEVKMHKRLMEKTN